MINEFQEKIKKFDETRGWDKHWNIKDLCLNMNEEIGELWHLIKWIPEEKQKEIIKENQNEADNFIGDVLFIILKMANQLGTDAEYELQKVLEEYEKRMPVGKMKEVGHANKLAGGHDEKE
ncbi:MAG: MazG nucleotide pyrophosphohydrolase domain-containing protein [Candidatus Pacearchaeota archaeon]